MGKIMMSYNELVASFSQNPRDVPTVPTTRRIPRWFYVFEKNNVIRVESGHFHGVHNSRISGSRPLKLQEFDTMMEIYRRRCTGETISREAGEKTWNQVYWYGVFAEINP